jgi:hypothetical protein
MRRRRAWRGLSMLIMEPKNSSISSGMSGCWWRPAPTVDLGVPAGLGDVGVAGHGAVAGPLGHDDEAARLGDLGLLEEGHRALPAQQSGRRPRARPRGGPRTRCPRGRSGRASGPDVVPRSSPYPRSVHCDHVRHPVWTGRRRHGLRQELGPPVGEVQLAVPFGRRPRPGAPAHAVPLHRRHRGPRRPPVLPHLALGGRARVNEFGVAIGNERVSTVHDAARPPGPDRHGPGAPRARAGPQRRRGARRPDRPPHDARPGRDRRRGPPGGVRLLVPHRRSDGRPSCSIRPAPTTRPPPSPGTAISNRLSVGSGWTLHRTSNRATTSTASATPTDTAFADVRLAASRRFLVDRAFRRLTPAATAAHLRDHGQRAVGRSRHRGPRSTRPRPRRGRTAAASASACTSAGPERDRGLHDRRAAPDLAAGAPLRAYVAAGQPVRQHLRARLSRTAAGPPPFVPFELSGEELWHAADALRQLVESRPRRAAVAVGVFQLVGSASLATHRWMYLIMGVLMDRCRRHRHCLARYHPLCHRHPHRLVVSPLRDH